MDFSSIRPFQHVALRLPNDQTRIERLTPNSLINLGKYGSFHTNHLFGRPYHLTFEILDRADACDDRELRIVPAAELHAATLLEEAETESGAATPSNEVDEYGLMTGDKSNVNITDDPTNQRLTMAEIEELKQDETGRTKDLIAKIMQSHTALDQKTAFSLAKYTLRKHRKYMKRFTVLPLDVATLTDFLMVEKDFSKVMELRNESLGLIGCWANIHASGDSHLPNLSNTGSRYLVVDDTGGLLVAAMAERMGILHQANPSSDPEPASDDEGPAQAAESAPQPTKPRRPQIPIQSSATTNTLTVIHSNQQPNLSLLRYFNFDIHNPTPTHPLHTHLKTLSWLQLLDPNSDSAYQEPPILPPPEISKLKSNRRSNYFRKRRRWERIKAIVDEARDGGYDALVVASYTSPVSILKHLVPLLAGGAQVVVYSPNVEPLLELTDLYSTARRTAYLQWLQQQEEQQQQREAIIDEHAQNGHRQDLTETPVKAEPAVKAEPPSSPSSPPSETPSQNANRTMSLDPPSHPQAPPIPPNPSEENPDFPLNPTLLLPPMLQTSRVRTWQVLPGRTHPQMTSKGGAEGYVWSSTRVLPLTGRVTARGKARRNAGKGS
ncbi:tRNA (adenine(58)-N(1))-methyltransferase non-catalytic subunit trm6 [Cyphellophora attinorum]|uniref:tRNA (adenine(58)-N(1))-methyltransferase non-catalytic subunit TRM6 n=1 Tax=Cyphellophora attinorum TaxID=1664694 RepID=A0A0N1P1J5_9EURO|nr:tRNA (adenine(58)-N(1))-methyltransferase non-catalytic subunit trm6 [Phialophora attinorum]KPI41923.1 tRNA (adenine(58)-N(1))-methyltransferase non-catalytic subunit trm6 [Phialophora attinorum]